MNLEQYDSMKREALAESNWKLQIFIESLTDTQKKDALSNCFNNLKDTNNIAILNNFSEDNLYSMNLKDAEELLNISQRLLFLTNNNLN